MTGEVDRFESVMRRLQRECPWKASQTHATLARYLLEETHEALEAMDTGDMVLLREELGDLLLQVVLHSVIAERAGEFSLDDVARDVTEKVVRRNQHVFGTDAALSAEEANEVWQRAKVAEKQRTEVTEGIPETMPALLWADKVAERLERAGSPVTVLPETEVGDEGTALGERLLALVLESRAAGLDPEQQLRNAVRRRL